MIIFYTSALGRFKSEGCKVYKFSKLHGAFLFDFNKPACGSLKEAVNNHYSESYESDETIISGKGL